MPPLAQRRSGAERCGGSTPPWRCSAASLIPFLMFTRQKHAIDQMTAVWLLPVVAGEVVAASGGLLAPHIAAPAAS